MSIAVTAIASARTFDEAVRLGGLLDLSPIPLGAHQTFPCRVAVTASVAERVLGYPRGRAGCVQFARAVALLRAARAALRRAPAGADAAFELSLGLGRDEPERGRPVRVRLQWRWLVIEGAPALVIALADGGGALAELRP